MIQWLLYCCMEIFTSHTYITVAKQYMCCIHITTVDVFVVQRIQPLFKESVQYDLPKKLLEPLNHCFFYFEIMEVHMNVLIKVPYKYLIVLMWSNFKDSDVLNKWQMLDYRV